MKTIYICIVEDLAVIRNRMQEVIENAEGFSCLGAFESAEEAAAALPDLQPDVVLMDINLPAMSGIDCIRQVKGICKETQFMMYTVYDDNTHIFDALKAGANGYLLKKTAPQKVLDAILELYEGGSVMSAEIARKVMQSFHEDTNTKEIENHNLTTRELTILEQLANGLLYKEIGEKLSITTGTVKQHIHKIYEKLHVQNRTEAINKVFGKK